MRLCAFGDSFVNGTGDPEHRGWLGRALAGAHTVTLYNLGVRGDRSSDIRARWRGEAECRLAAVQEGRVLFSFGVNDCCADAMGRPRVAPAHAVRNAAAILADSAARWPTLMVGPPPIADDSVNRRTAALNAAFAGAARAAGVPYCDVFDALAGNRLWMAEVAAWDGAHPGAAGYALLARLVGAAPAWRAFLAGAGAALPITGRG